MNYPQTQGQPMPQNLVTPASPQDLANIVAKLACDLAELQRQVQAREMQGGGGSGHPCKKQPYWYTAEIALAQGSSARTPGTFTVSQDGPFVALALQAAWRETAGPTAGRWLPPSSEEMVIRAISQFNFVSNIPRPDPVDFEYEISDGNSDRNWQDKPVPSSFLYSVGGQPAYLPVTKEFDPNTTVTVMLTPIRPVSATGILKFTFLGYKNLSLPR